jgi:hypothetical protein
MTAKLAHIDTILGRLERLAEELKADPDGHLRRAANELRAAFTARTEIEPAVARVRAGVQMIRQGNHEGSRREFQRRAPSLDHLDDVVERELIPHLRSIGFHV